MKVYFPGLNTIRLYAAVCVVVHHVLNVSHTIPSITMTGGNAVTLFFVLSGFLITYLLLEEKRKTGTIDLAGFYWRRNLRIWPLYYLVVILAYLTPVLRPAAWTWPYTFGFGVAFIHNVEGAGLSQIGHLWSIGVEEIFYLLWPILLRRYPVVRVCALVILARFVIAFLTPYGASAEVAYVLDLFRFECMAIGGLAAWLYHTRAQGRSRQWLRVLYYPVVAWLMFALIVLVNFNAAWGDTFMLSFVFAVVILNIATNPRFPKFEHPWLSWWGQRTYGVYMWHYPIIGVLAGTIAVLGWTLGTVLTVAATLIVAAASYQWVELPFLRLKDRRFTRKPHPELPARNAV